MSTARFSEKVIIEASVHDVYEALVDPEKMKLWSGDSKATCGRNAGDEISAWDGYATGHVVSAVTDHVVVQRWKGKGDDFPAPATFVFALLPAGATSCSIHFTADGIPESWTEKGWDKWYWNPLRKLLEGKKKASKRARDADADKPEEDSDAVRNAVCHVELSATDIDRAKTFYTTAFGWSFNQWMPEYALFEAPGKGEGVNGGITLVKTPEEIETVANIFVTDIDAALAKINKAGGSTVVGRTLISPEFGSYATFRDTEGNKVGLYEPNMQAAANGGAGGSD